MPRTNINYFFFCERWWDTLEVFGNDIRLRNAFIELLGELFDALGLSRVICEVMHFFGIGFAVVEFGAERAVFAPEVEAVTGVAD